jgi:hypothetical protein
MYRRNRRFVSDKAYKQRILSRNLTGHCIMDDDNSIAFYNGGTINESNESSLYTVNYYKTTTIRWPRFLFSFNYRITCWLVVVHYYMRYGYNNDSDNILIVTSYETMSTNNVYSTQIMMILITMITISNIMMMMMTIAMMIL